MKKKKIEKELWKRKKENELSTKEIKGEKLKNIIHKTTHGFMK